MLNAQLCNINTGKAPLPSSASPALVSVARVESIKAASIRPKPTSFERRFGPLTTRRKIVVKAESMGVAATPPDHEGLPMKRVLPLKATVTVRKRFDGLRGTHIDKEGPTETILLELVSTEPHEQKGWKLKAIKVKEDERVEIYEGESMETFQGEVGAVLVENQHEKEVYLQNIRLSKGFLGDGHIEFTCNSWVHSKLDNPENRIFFTNKSYLPNQTPPALVKYRTQELQQLRGTGEGERKKFERIYDYDTYNDLGDPDKGIDLKRAVLGGSEHPYPRRCRTGRPRTQTDPLSEVKANPDPTKPDPEKVNYVPRDENFSDQKQISFGGNKALITEFHHVLGKTYPKKNSPFSYFTDIETLYHEDEDKDKDKDEDEDIKITNEHSNFTDALPKLVNKKDDEIPNEHSITEDLQFDIPSVFFSDRFGWLKDQEFGRQTLAGTNPLTIKLVTEWPLKSKLQPGIYGPPDSGITTELVQSQIGGSVEEAIKQKKLFVVDYHDTLLPYVHNVRALGEGSTLYGSRSLFYLEPNQTLRPIAIELVRPPSKDGSKPQWKHVYTPNGDSTANWLWTFAKAHALANDSAFHQLISHWLRTHCSAEPYAIATHRQLSEMHPIHRLLRPHFKYTFEINANARTTLVNAYNPRSKLIIAGGALEELFNLKKYSMEFSSEVYKTWWRFDMESLPADLINRGMATEDPSAPHGLRLTIEDYPYASDGLLIWDCIKEWVTTYVKHYYPSKQYVELDNELQAWWAEIRLQGHQDKKDGWPKLETPDDLIGILTTMIWVVSAHHAAINFGQYSYSGYFPNRPTVARNKMPDEEPTEQEWKLFIEQPEKALLQSSPSKYQAIHAMAIMYVLSTHSPDEEYLGENPEPAWVEDDVIGAAFERFSGRLKEIEGIVDDRNGQHWLKNRYGAGVVPYELLKPFSEAGITAKGIPNSVSI